MKCHDKSIPTAQVQKKGCLKKGEGCPPGRETGQTRKNRIPIPPEKGKEDSFVNANISIQGKEEQDRD